MNRKKFLLSLPLIGLAAKAVAKVDIKPKLGEAILKEGNYPLYYRADGTFHPLPEGERGKVLVCREDSVERKFLEYHPCNGKKILKGGTLEWENGFGSRVIFKYIS